MLGAIALIFARHGNQVALGATVAAVAGSFLVSYTRAKAEALGLRGDIGLGSRAERVVVITAGPLPRPRGGGGGGAAGGLRARAGGPVGGAFPPPPPGGGAPGPGGFLFGGARLR